VSLVEEGITDGNDTEYVREIRDDDVILKVDFSSWMSLEGNYLFGRSVGELGGDDDGVGLSDIGDLGDVRDQNFPPETLNETGTVDEFEGFRGTVSRRHPKDGTFPTEPEPIESLQRDKSPHIQHLGSPLREFSRRGDRPRVRPS